MGQMTYGVLFGVRMKPPKELGDDGWWAAGDSFPGKTKLAMPSGDALFCGTGFWVAVGASGRPGVPSLGHPVQLDRLATTKPYAAALRKAAAAWVRFEKWWAKECPKTKLPPPQLWLVETEVA